MNHTSEVIELPLRLIHGLGGRSDLPIPLPLAQTAAIVVLFATFAMLSKAWQTPRFDKPLTLPAPPKGFTAIITSVVGVSAFATFIVYLITGPNDSGSNPAPTWFYVWFWVGLVPASLLFGPVVRAFSPYRAVLSVARKVGLRAHPYPQRLGYWPAAASLLAFLWLELVYADRDLPRTILTFVTIYSAVQLVGALRYGSEWLEKADGFEVYSTFIAHLRLRRRGNPLRGLGAFPQGSSVAAVIFVLLGSTAFDGLTRTQRWASWFDATSGFSRDLLGTAGLLGSIAAVALLFVWASYMATNSMKEPTKRTTSALNNAFVPTLLPIVIGYTVAHYFSIFVFQGQAGYQLVTQSGSIDYSFVSTMTIAIVQIVAILLGHVVGVVSAHDRSVALFNDKDKKVGQYPLMACMVIFTFAGIALLLGA